MIFVDVHLVAAACKFKMLFWCTYPLYCMRPEICDWNNRNIRLSTMVTLLCCSWLCKTFSLSTQNKVGVDSSHNSFWDKMELTGIGLEIAG
ncbi:hypothetical protein BDA96_08G132000 [Sorghum bicolor]|uniref:Uncharacterized protein n=1 Tax=Sorghum bicolor TaxID=4558 RepID=A0A921QGF5_SORBI|nr:hypothetical protein BDA96_08G132000 [Sorghum bicolor]